MTRVALLGAAALCGVLPIVGGLLLAATLTDTNELPVAPAGSSILDGVVTAADTLEAPVGAPFVYGRVRIGAPYRSGRTTYSETRVDEVRGADVITVEDATGVRHSVRMGPPDKTFRAFPTDHQIVRELGGPDRSLGVPGPAGWDVDLLVLRPGNAVFVVVDADGVASEVWWGGRAALAQHVAGLERARHALVGLGAALLLLGTLLVAGLLVGAWRAT